MNAEEQDTELKAMDVEAKRLSNWLNKDPSRYQYFLIELLANSGFNGYEAMGLLEQVKFEYLHIANDVELEGEEE